MTNLVMMHPTQRPPLRRTWDDEDLGGIREAEAREAKAQRDSDVREKAERERGNQAETREVRAAAPKSTFRERLAKVGKGLLRGGLSIATGGMSETALAAGRMVKGFMDRRAARGGGVSRGSRSPGSEPREREGGGRDRDLRETGFNPMIRVVRRVPPRRKVAPKPIVSPPAPVIAAPFVPHTVYASPLAVPTYGSTTINGRTWDVDEPEELAGLGKSLKKLGKKLKKAIKPKNLLKTAAIAAVAYGGYKFATSVGGKGVLSKLGSGLMKAGSAALKVAPQVASSYIAYKTATAPAARTVGYDETELPEEAYNLVQDPQGTYELPGASLEDRPARSTSSPLSTMPSWVLPVGIGAGVLLLLTSRNR